MNLRSATLLATILLLSLFLRLPTLSQGKPFFYEEDEAHHFNRIVEMVKKRTLDPEYFHKPSLHFYLRMPAVVAGYLLETKNTPDDSIQKIKTRDRYGLARYSFNWSHPRVVYAVRAVSLLLTMLTCILVYILSIQLGLSSATALAATAIYSVSPEIFHYSSFIGVDVPLMFFSCLATSVALAVSKSVTTKNLWIVGIISGLAVSSKYNGLPIALLPLVLLLYSPAKKTTAAYIAAISSPIVGFFIASPYILISFSQFYSQLSYEVWHYAVAGHEGHMAKPGIEQVIHYSKWLASDGIGLVASLASAAGVVILFRKKKREAILFALFPFLFFSLMCAQKVNFVRNMLPIIPYLSVFAALCFATICEKFKNNLYQLTILILITLLALYSPYQRTRALQAEFNIHDTRLELEAWVIENSPKEIAIDGELQPQPNITKMPHVVVVNPQQSFDQLYQSGFDLVARSGFTPLSMTTEVTSVREVKRIPGEESEQRVLKNPAIHIFELSRSAEAPFLPNLESNSLKLDQPLTTGDEGHLWISKRLTRLQFNDARSSEAPLHLTFEIMSPWKDQHIELIGKDWSKQILLNQKNPGEWISVEFDVPSGAFLENNVLVLYVNTIRSPADAGLNRDTRHLGIAIKSVSTN